MLYEEAKQEFIIALEQFTDFVSIGEKMRAISNVKVSATINKKSVIMTCTKETRP